MTTKEEDELLRFSLLFEVDMTAITLAPPIIADETFPVFFPVALKWAVLLFIFPFPLD